MTEFRGTPGAADATVVIPGRAGLSPHRSDSAILLRVLVLTVALAPALAPGVAALTGSFAYVTLLDPSNAVAVIETATNTVVATVPVGHQPLGVAVLPDGSAVYVADYGSDAGETVSVIDAATNTVSATIVVGDSPVGVAVHPDGSRVYVTNILGFDVAVIDTETNDVVARVPGDFIFPEGIAVHPDGSKLYVGDENGSLHVVDSAINAVVDVVHLDQWGMWGVVVHPNGGTVYATSRHRDTVSVIETTGNTLVATVAVGDEPIGVAVHPSGSHVYVANTGSVSIIETAGNTVVGTVVVDAAWGISIHPDGSRAYVNSPSSDGVSVIDLATNSVTETVPVGGRPTAVGQFIGPLPATVGGSASGQSLNAVRCRNVTTGQAVQKNLYRAIASWDCEAAGLVVNPGDEIRMVTFGSAVSTPSTPSVGGVATGQAVRQVRCQNLATGADARVTLQDWWNCEAAGLEVEGGDRVRVVVSGIARSR